MIRKLTLFSIFISLMYAGSAQTTISGGAVSGTWTRANSPYLINGNIAVPNGSTLTIEPGVSIQFAQFKYMNVDGRIIAIGGSKATDSIWFTKQNPSDTGSWKGVKFIKTANTNDTSLFKYCVFRYCKSLYDTTIANRSGGITVIGYGKVKIANSTFYRNEAGMGACIYIVSNGFATIMSSEFKMNKASIFPYTSIYGPNSYYRPKGSAISVDYNANALIDSCTFKKNIRGKKYGDPNAILYEASTVDVEGYTYYKLNAYATITNCLFDGNEGYTLYAYDRATVTLTNCTFVNAPKGKSLAVVYSYYLSDIKMNQCSMTSNQSDVLLKLESGNILFDKGLINLNTNFISTYTGSSSSLNVQNSKIINNYGGLNAIDNTLSGSFRANNVLNCLIANNYIAVPVACNYLYNSTIVNNRSGRIGILGSDLVCKNSIIWGNKCDSFSGKQLFNVANTYSSYTNCLIENDTAAFGWPKMGYTWKKPDVYKNNISSNPLFVNPTAGAGLGFNASLADFSVKNTCALSSPVINAGASDILYILPSTDLNGNPRFYEESLDIGCYENVSGVPSIRILKQPKKDTVCEKSRKGELTVSAIGKGLVYQWQQSTNGGSTWSDISGQNNAKLSVLTTPAQNNIIYRAILNGSCDKDTSAPASILTLDAPFLRIGFDKAVCKYDGLLVTVTGAIGNYLWHTGSTSNKLMQTITKDTIWWLQITNAQGCSARDSIFITCIPLPVINLGADQSIDHLKQITLDAGAGHKSYLWNDSSKLQSRTFQGQDLGPAGTYTLWVEVTDSNGCSNRDSIQITVTGNSGIVATALGSVAIYPQPVGDVLLVKLPASLNTDDLQMRISDIEGRCLYDVPYQASSGRISVEHLQAGIYLISITDLSSGQSMTMKWIKS